MYIRLSLPLVRILLPDGSFLSDTASGFLPQLLLVLFCGMPMAIRIGMVRNFVTWCSPELLWCISPSYLGCFLFCLMIYNVVSDGQRLSFSVVPKQIQQVKPFPALNSWQRLL